MTRLRLFLICSGAIGVALLAIPSRSQTDTAGAPDAAPVPGPSSAEREPPARSMPRPDPGLLAAQRKRSATLGWGRDPFSPAWPPVAIESEPAEPATTVRTEFPAAPPPAQVVMPRLTGISRSGARRWAIIDREIVQEGDALPSGHRVSRIEGSTVTLLLDHEPVVLSIGDGR